MAEPKTQRAHASVHGFLEKVADEARRKDCKTLLGIMKQAGRAEPEMWGTSIVGFGSYRYEYAGERTGDWFRIGFAPRKQDLTVLKRLLSASVKGLKPPRA